MVAYFLDNLPHHLSGVPPDFVRHRVHIGQERCELGCRPKSGGAWETASAQRSRPDKWWGTLLDLFADRRSR
jgi:hypothetical protein